MNKAERKRYRIALQLHDILTKTFVLSPPKVALDRSTISQYLKISRALPKVAASAIRIAQTNASDRSERAEQFERLGLAFDACRDLIQNANRIYATMQAISVPPPLDTDGNPPAADGTGFAPTCTESMLNPAFAKQNVDAFFRDNDNPRIRVKYPASTYDYKSITVSFRTKPITMVATQEDNASHTFAPFDIKIQALFNHHAETELIRVDVTPTVDDYAMVDRAEECCHPHVRDDILCLGDASVPLRMALKRGDVDDAAQIVVATLSNYNPRSPHMDLMEWISPTPLRPKCSFCRQNYPEAQLEDVILPDDFHGIPDALLDTNESLIEVRLCSQCNRKHYDTGEQISTVNTLGIMNDERVMCHMFFGESGRCNGCNRYYLPTEQNPYPHHDATAAGLCRSCAASGLALTRNGTIVRPEDTRVVAGIRYITRSQERAEQLHLEHERVAPSFNPADGSPPEVDPVVAQRRDQHPDPSRHLRLRTMYRWFHDNNITPPFGYPWVNNHRPAASAIRRFFNRKVNELAGLPVQPFWIDTLPDPIHEANEAYVVRVEAMIDAVYDTIAAA